MIRCPQVGRELKPLVATKFHVLTFHTRVLQHSRSNFSSTKPSNAGQMKGGQSEEGELTADIMINILGINHMRSCKTCTHAETAEQGGVEPGP